MNTEFTQEDNLILQSYIIISLLSELQSNNLLSSEYFEGMTFGMRWIKDELRSSGSIGNRGCALIALYAMLVIPRELVREQFSAEYAEIDDFLKNCAQDTKTTYKCDDYDPSTAQYLWHIRNAVAHARVSFQSNGAVLFTDEKISKNKIESFSTELSFQNLNELLNQLQKVHLKYIEKIQTRGVTS